MIRDLHRLLPVATAALACLLGPAALASDFAVDADFMELLDDRTRSLSSRLALRDLAGARDDARAISGFFGEMAAYYAKRAPGGDAATWASEGREAADEIARLALAGDLDHAQQSATVLTGTCRACHRVYK